jgi:MFS family permease
MSESVDQGHGDAGTPATRGPHFGALWRDTEFLKFWSGETISLFGTYVTTLALPLLAVITLNVSAQQLGYLRAAEFLPFLLAPVFGVWADRRRRKPVMTVANAARAVLVALVPTLYWLGHLPLNTLYLIAFAVGLCTVAFDVSWMSFVPTLVPREYLIEANGKIATSYSAAEVGGPGLAGVLVQVFTAPVALLVDAASYVVSVVSLLLIRRPEPEPERRQTRHMGKEIREGLAAVFGNQYLRITALQGTIFNFFMMFIETTFVLYLVRELGFRAVLVGLVVAAGAVGGLLGAMIATSLTRRLPFGPLIMVAMVVGCTPTLLLPAVRGSTAVMAAAFVVVLFVYKGGSGVANVLAITLRQTVTPNRLLGRVTASMRLALYGAYPLGALTAGFLGASIGLRSTLLVAGIGFTASLIPVLLSPLPRLAALPPSPDETPAAPPAVPAGTEATDQLTDQTAGVTPRGTPTSTE